MTTIKKSLAVILSVLMIAASGAILVNAEGVFTVTFDANGGTFAANAVTLKAVNEGSDITAEGISTPTCTFKEFAGWALDKAAETGAVEATDIIGTMGSESMTVYAVWADAACGENATYTVANGLLTISGSGVITGSEDWAKNAASIASVAFAEGCTFDGIGEKAFAGLTALKTINLSAVADIAAASGAFEGCTALESIVLPAGAKVIPEKCFKGCTALKDFSFDGIEEIGDEAFYGCTAMPTTLVFEKGVDIRLNPIGSAFGFGTDGKAIKDYTIVTDGESLTEYAKTNGFYMSHTTYSFTRTFSFAKRIIPSLSKIIPAFWNIIVSAFNSVISVFNRVSK